MTPRPDLTLPFESDSSALGSAMHVVLPSIYISDLGFLPIINIMSGEVDEKLPVSGSPCRTLRRASAVSSDTHGGVDYLSLNGSPS